MRPPCFALCLCTPALFPTQDPGHAVKPVITLRMAQESGGATNHPLPMNELRDLAAKALSGESIQIVEANDSAGAVSDFDVRVQALRAPNGVVIYGISSSMATRGAKPGSPSNLVGAVRDPAKLVEIIAAAVSDVIQSQIVLHRPTTEKPSLAGVPVPIAASSRAAGMEFSQVKVRHQPTPPPYPRVAILRRIQGTVRMEILINPDGLPDSARVIEGPAALQMTALAYALEWTFEPSKLNGVPQWARYKLSIPFRLPSEEGPWSDMPRDRDRRTREAFPNGPDPRH